MSNTKPYVQVACICERALQEPDNVFSAIRIVDVLTLKQTNLPTYAQRDERGNPITIVQVIDLTILISLKAGQLSGQFNLAVELTDPAGSKIRLSDESPVALKGDDGVNYVLRFGLPHNAPVGVYWFDVLWNGEVLSRIPLTLKRAEDPTSAVSPTPS